jgi:hypothetical protein
MASLLKLLAAASAVTVALATPYGSARVAVRQDDVDAVFTDEITLPCGCWNECNLFGAFANLDTSDCPTTCSKLLPYLCSSHPFLPSATWRVLGEEW